MKALVIAALLLTTAANWGSSSASSASSAIIRTAFAKHQGGDADDERRHKLMKPHAPPAKIGGGDRFTTEESRLKRYRSRIVSAKDLNARMINANKGGASEPLKTTGIAETYSVTVVSSFPFNVTAGGGAILHADATVPVPSATNPTEKFPVVFFPNSWSCPEQEYYIKIQQMAAAGYVCVEYQTRGWYESTGLIDTAGPFDRSDGSQLIDYILATYGTQWNIDPSKIAFGGISYGGGITLEMAGYDDRVKTTLALSGWGSLIDSMYQNQSPNTASLDLLVGIAQVTGKPGADLIAMRENIINHKNISEVIAYGAQRGADMYIPVFNKANKPIFMSNNYLDRFFNPQAIAQMFSAITSTNKLLLFNNGGHAEAEVLGVAGLESYPWTLGVQWLDAILKGVDNGILAGPQVRMQYGDSIFSADYWTYQTVPPPYVAGMKLLPRSEGTPNAVGGIAGVNEALAAFEKDLAMKGKATAHSGVKQHDKNKLANPFADPDASEEQLWTTFVAHTSTMPSVTDANRADAFRVLMAKRHHLWEKKKDGAARAMGAQGGLKADGSGEELGACALSTPSFDVADYVKTTDGTNNLGTAYNNTISFTTSPSLNQGSMITDFLRSFGIPAEYALDLVSAQTNLVFVSEPLAVDGNLCGFPELTNVNIIPVVPPLNTVSPNWQVYFYLYDVDGLCLGKLLSDGVFTRWSDSTTPVQNSDGSYTIPSITLRGLCATIPAGHRVGLGAVLYNDQFTPASQNIDVTFKYNTGANIKLPFA